MLRLPAIVLFAAFAAALLGAQPACADVLYPKGLRIGLAPPAGMTPSARFSGFEDMERKASIKILDLPAAAYESLEKGAFAAPKQGSKVTIEKRESFPFNDGVGFLVTFDQEKDGATVHRWLMIAKSMSRSVPNLATLVDVEVPDAARSVYSDAAVRAALKSVTFRPAPITEQLSLMPFKLNELADFRVMRVLPTGAAILINGPDDDVSRNPYMIVAVGQGAPQKADDRTEFSRQLLVTAPLPALKLTSMETIRIHNFPAVEIRAQAKGPRGEALSVIQWVRFGGTGFLRIVGVTPKDKWDALFPRFRAVRDGVAPREH
ncbi:MAG TPA: hypothetical protein VFX37_13340 [Pseudolabrys sp.]|nr:hypothetical protein [Pseudolabrys sp.]